LTFVPSGCFERGALLCSSTRPLAFLEATLVTLPSSQPAVRSATNNEIATRLYLSPKTIE
jgi:hypothetical protein